MAKIKTVRVYMQKTVQVTRFNPIVVGVERVAELEDGDDASSVIQKLQNLCHQDCQHGVKMDMDYDW